MGAARITQEGVEVIVEPDDEKARLTQEAIEVIVAPDDSKVRPTQIAIEVIVGRVKRRKQFVLIG